MQTQQQQKHYRYAATLRRLVRREAGGHVRKMLNRLHPADVAQVYSYFTVAERVEFLSCMADNSGRADILSHLGPSDAADIVTRLELKTAVDIICEMSGADQADLLGELDDELASRIMEAMPQQDSDDVQELLRYDEKSAGGIMNTDLVSIHMDATVTEAIRVVREASDVDTYFYIYAVDDHHSLTGVLSLRHLVTSKPDVVIKTIMNPNVVAVRTEEHQEDVARLVMRYDFLAIPVVDDTNHLVGVISVDDVVDVINEEATEDILKMAGAGDDTLDSPSIFRNVMHRAPWLFAAMVGGLAASQVISSFEQTLSRFIVLAAFIPVITGMAGNVGTQSLAVVVRGLATRRIKVRVFWRTVGKEILSGMILGIIYGLIIGSVGLWGVYGKSDQAFRLAASIAIAAATAMTLAALIASSIPLFFARINIDPAVATGPFVTTTSDILGVMVYFTVVNFLV